MRSGWTKSRTLRRVIDGSLVPPSVEIIFSDPRSRPRDRKRHCSPPMVGIKPPSVTDRETHPPAAGTRSDPASSRVFFRPTNRSSSADLARPNARETERRETMSYARSRVSRGGRPRQKHRSCARLVALKVNGLGALFRPESIKSLFVKTTSRYDVRIDGEREKGAYSRHTTQFQRRVKRELFNKGDLAGSMKLILNYIYISEVNYSRRFSLLRARERTENSLLVNDDPSKDCPSSHAGDMITQ